MNWIVRSCCAVGFATADVLAKSLTKSLAKSLAKSFVPMFALAFPFASIPSVQAQPFGQPRNQPHVNAPVEKRVTWEIFQAMPTHLQRTLPTTVRNLRGACTGWGGVALQAGENVDGTVICAQDQQSTVKYTAYRNFGTDYVAASILVSLHTAIQVDPERRSELMAAFKQPQTLNRLVTQGLNHALRVGFPLVQSSREVLTASVTKIVLTALQNPDWDRSLYGSLADYEVLSQSFCKAQGLSQQQAQIVATQLKGYQLYATCWMEFGLPSQMVRDFRIAKHLTNPQPQPQPQPPIAPREDIGSRVTTKTVKTRL
jgi:hypothetical protein